MIAWTRLIFFLALPIVLVMSPVLFGGKIYANGDTWTILLPNLHFFGEALKAGESFLWNPYMLGGFPSYASLVGGFFAPLNLVLFKVFSVTTAYHWAIFVNLFLTALFNALFLKKIGLTMRAQIFGAWIFVMSQWFSVPDLGIVNSLPVLPLIFLIIWQIYERHRSALPPANWQVLVGGGAIGYMWLAAHYNWLLMILVAAFLFSWFLGRQVFGKFLLMNLVGGAIGLVQIFPGIIYAQFSAREGALSFAQASVGAINVFDLPRLFLPYFRLPFVGNAESQLYLGVIPLFFLAVGIGLRDRLAKFFSVLFVFSLALGVKYSPLFWLLHKLPVFSNFRGPSRWMFIGLFAGSIVAALGLDKFSEVSEKWRKIVMHVVGWSGLGAAAGSLVLSFILLIGRGRILAYLAQYFNDRIYPSTVKLPVEHYLRVIENLYNQTLDIFSFQNPRYLFSIFFLFVSVLVVFVFAAGLREIRKQQLLAITAANLVLVFLFFHPTASAEIWRSSSRTAALISDRQAYTLSLLPGFTEWTKLTVPYQSVSEDQIIFGQELLSPNFQIFYQIKSLDAYENLMPRRLARLLALLGSDRATLGEKLAEEKLPIEQKIKIFLDRKYLLDLLSVKYVVSAYPLEHPGLSKIGEVEATKHRVPVLVYENKGARSLVYFAENIEALNIDENKVYEKLANNSDSTLTYLECDPCPEVQGGRGKVEILSWKNNFWKIKTSLEHPGLLVVAQSNLPGWQATIDGKAASIYFVNSVFSGIVVPAGEHEIQFAYRLINLIKKR